ncbi:family 1 glycosylhydrolase [Enterococcus songbeiensis]|uniref:family 1 glycosylhydrolase n=1 Tax=Enterococcus songbeiensis TaxID=2559927 RepID=UPI0010F6C2E6|nr:glycoside hydrolase family 1 protein [Enterococcus songbeiensis]
MNKILWGGATSASQYEGDLRKGLDTQDCRAYLPRTSTNTITTRLLKQADLEEAKKKDPINFYPFRKGSLGITHVDEDLDLLEELGVDIYRLSISWSRLFPNGDELIPNKEGIAYYDHIFKHLKKSKIKIFLTINHYALPLHLVETYGGWANKKLIDFYLRLVETIFSHWGNMIDYYLPFNEINAGYFSPFNGVGVLRKSDDSYDYTEVFQALHHQFVASAKTIRLGREMNVSGKFGCMIACFCYYPLTPRPEDNLKLVLDEQVNQWFCMDVLARGSYPYYMEKFFREHHVHLTITDEDRQLLKNFTADFVSFSYYSSSICTIDETSEQQAGNLVATHKNPYLQASEWGWQIDPLGIRTTLHKVYDRYEKPVIISENGFGARDVLEDLAIHDTYRIDYFEKHFKEIIKAKEEGVGIEAYMAWGIIDIVSAGSCEMAKRYGVIYVDADNHGNGSYKRYKKDSFYWYKQFIATQKVQLKREEP